MRFCTNQDPRTAKVAWCSIGARHLFIRQQTAVINAIRAHLAEFGIVAPVGRHGVEELLNCRSPIQTNKRVPEMAPYVSPGIRSSIARGIKEQILEVRPA